MKLYEELAGHVAALIEAGVLRARERLPSVRQLARERRISVATAMHAFELLEARGFIEARPRSGYYVSAAPTRPAAAPRTRTPWSTVDSLPPGSAELRRQIARRYLRFGVRVLADEIVITNGAMEALNLSLQAVTKPGDAIAIESLSFYGCLQAVESLGLRAVEVPTDPREGVSLAALEQVLDTHRVRACWFMTSFQNPLGATMPDDKKRDLVRLLDAHDVPLIEDDAYAELYFGSNRPRAAKAFDARRLVLHCGSFSKCLAPGYRLGWVAAGRFARDVERRKVMTSISTSLPVQDGIADLLRRGGYDAHLTKLRRTLAAQQSALLGSLQRHWRGEYRVTRPDGGYFVWLELPRAVDCLELHRRALEHGISIAPGPIFSPRREYRNCIRLNYGHPWTPELDRAIERLAELAAASSE